MRELSEMTASDADDCDADESIEDVLAAEVAAGKGVTEDMTGSERPSGRNVERRREEGKW